MADPSPLKVPEPSSRDLRSDALRRRIEHLEGQDDACFGRFTGWDWLCCVLLSIALPALAAWWFAP